MSPLPGKKEGPNLTPKMRNRRYPVKCMQVFNGRIHLERISKTTTAQKQSMNQRFLDDRDINNSLKDGAIHDILLVGAEDMILLDVTELIGFSYGLKDGVVSLLVFVYSTYIGRKGSIKPMYIKEDHKQIIGNCTCRIDANPNVAQVPLTILDTLEEGLTKPMYIKEDHKQIIGNHIYRIDTNPSVAQVSLTIFD